MFRGVEGVPVIVIIYGGLYPPDDSFEGGIPSNGQMVGVDLEVVWGDSGILSVDMGE